MASDDLTTGGVFTALAASIGWLVKELYKAPRQAEYDRVLKDNDGYKKLIDETTARAKELSDAREAEYDKLRVQVVELQGRLIKASGAAYVDPGQVTEERRRGAPGRRAADRIPADGNGGHIERRLQAAHDPHRPQGAGHRDK